MILYRKSANLRMRRLPAPEPPWWSATFLSPYSGRRGVPVPIDYFDMHASWSERLEVAVCDNTTTEVERANASEPILIDATEFAEVVFRRGDEALRAAADSAVIYLISSNSAVPSNVPPRCTIAIAAWPLDFERLEVLCAEAAPHRWGLVVPVMFPATTELEALSDLCELAAKHHAAFFAAAAVDVDPTAKQAIATTMSPDEDTYAMLFHADLDPIHTATERHIAALAAESAMADVVLLPNANEKSNWNASALLTLTATRMIAMERDVESATMIARSARAVAELNKPLARIAEAASLSIVEALDEVSVDILTEWLDSGTSWFVERVNCDWRLRRDAGLQASNAGD